MCCEKDLSYEEAKQLCQMAFDAGVDYHHTCVQFNCNAVAYDWEHWLKRNERLFRPKPTVEDVLAEMLDEHRRWFDGEGERTIGEMVADYAGRLRLKEDE